ncbi:MAG: HD domain-containing phosphohydrolase [Spirochaetota bacterium]
MYEIRPSTRAAHLFGRAAAAVCREAEEFSLFRQIAERTLQPLVLCDMDGTIQYVNESFAALYAYPRASLMGKNPRFIRATPAEYRRFGISETEARTNTEEMWRTVSPPDPLPWSGRFINRMSTGELVEVRTTIVPIERPRGSVIGYAGLPVRVSPERVAVRRERLGMLSALAGLAEQRDTETGAHMQRVGIYCHVLAQALDLTPSFRTELAVYSPLHDVGKVAIPDTILLAPRELNSEEREVMKTHTTVGYQILRKSGALRLACEIALYHHERWDGRGYPEGRSGEGIPLAARIMAVADAYDAIRSERPYSAAQPHDTAVERITIATGQHFDPRVVAALERASDEFKLIAATEDAADRRMAAIRDAYVCDDDRGTSEHTGGTVMSEARERDGSRADNHGIARSKGPGNERRSSGVSMRRHRT